MSQTDRRPSRILTPNFKPSGIGRTGGVGFLTPSKTYQERVASMTPDHRSTGGGRSPEVIAPYAIHSVESPGYMERHRPSTAPNRRSAPNGGFATTRNPIVGDEKYQAARPMRKQVPVPYIDREPMQRPIRKMGQNQPVDAAGQLSHRAFLWPHHRSQMKTSLPKPSDAGEESKPTGDTRLRHLSQGHFSKSVDMRDILGQKGYVGVEEFRWQSKKTQFPIQHADEYEFHGASITYKGPEKARKPQIRPGSAHPDLSISETKRNTLGQRAVADRPEGLKVTTKDSETSLCRDTLGYNFRYGADGKGAGAAAVVGRDGGYAERRAAYEAGLKAAMAGRAKQNHEYNINRARAETTNTSLTSFLYS